VGQLWLNRHGTIGSLKRILTKPVTQPSTQFDSPWKDIVENYLPEFIAFFFPQAYTAIDWSRGFTFLEQELRQVVRDAELGKRFVLS
jgi:hypothetical protein